MHLISIRKLRIDTNQFPDVKKQVEDWYTTTKKAEWTNLEDVRLIYRDAEAVGNFTVFNIKGNAYRLIVGIDYENQVIYYKYFLTHAQYDKDKWKNDPYF
ncbi:type II toxin-antitoxin system HigB family toxin [Rivularia sp. UHCC 0363]|uniref:type II toxin-antitoxin system HigB family toxin n=1 Tax=Rivularia sp. UHCC 0363 TaxID=3110244 RepID=UPI002B21B389|nr:type II toxin-antitoxin system HigB family toxin [Rivularia sp. UHCC 0363]MEA5599254.1 type II toxin-antitoxin system HigB family toxin [Rivularia sp. UHCC 0363]